MSETSAVVEKSLRSVFVGNIPYEATEEKLRDIFSQVGPVLSFKLMYDRESGKPKGYGFCEYKDQETALSAMRNLNGYEIGGRPLRVDNACTEKSRMEMQSLMMGPVVESPYGAEVEPNKAPEAISNAVASLPPEQMYELMRQMKLCVRNNPQEARTMLMNNPQLAYALLQAQVVMRIIDPKTAVQILHGARENVDPILPGSVTNAPTNHAPPTLNGGGPSIPTIPQPTSGPPPPSNLPTRYPPPIGGGGGASAGGGGPGAFQGPPPGALPPRGPPFQGSDFDMRQLGVGPRGPPPPQGNDQDMRLPPPGMGGPLPPPHDNYGPPPPQHDYDNRFSRDPRSDFEQRGEQRFRDPPLSARDTFPPSRSDSRDLRDRDSRGGGGGYRGEGGRGDGGGGSVVNRDPRGGGGPDRDYRSATSAANPVPPPAAPTDSRDPRATRSNYPPPQQQQQQQTQQDKDFRSAGSGPLPQMVAGGGGGGNNSQGPPRAVPPPPATTSSSSSSSSNLPSSLAGQDQEKASLIMQVLQLSDEQIKMLPPEQRASILQLKDQIQRSQH